MKALDLEGRARSEAIARKEGDGDIGCGHYDSRPYMFQPMEWYPSEEERRVVRCAIRSLFKTSLIKPLTFVFRLWIGRLIRLPTTRSEADALSARHATAYHALSTFRCVMR